METQNARRLLKALWKRACRWDAVSTDLRGRQKYDDCKFAVFSNDNPHARRHDKIMRLILAARCRYDGDSADTMKG